MAPATHTAPAIMARSKSISGGAIAGAVIGSVIGAGLLALVLGFVYFRIKRKLRESGAEAEAGKPGEQYGTTERRASHSAHRFSTQQYVPYSTDEQTTKDTNAPSSNTPSPGEEAPSYAAASSAQTAARYATDQAMPGSPVSPVSPVSPMSRRETSPDEMHTSVQEDRHPEDSVPEHQPIDEPINHEAANASYYDTRVSLDSDPTAPGPGSPDRQMSEMYEAQIKESRALAQKKNSGGSIKRFFDTLTKGRQSTQSSMDGSRGVDSPAFTAYGGISRAPTGQWEASGPAETQSLQFPGSREIFDEPEEMGDNGGPSGMTGFTPSPTTGRSPMSAHPQMRAKRMGTEAQQLARINSWRKEASIRETTEVDPELPSAVYGSRFGSSDSYYGGGFPHGAAPPAAQPLHPGQAPQQLPPAGSADQPSRLKSPEIPEPVYDEQANAQYYIPSTSATTSATAPQADPSPSPPLASESFVRPMHVMLPTTSTEKYYHTDYRLENPVSPVEPGPVLSSPQITDMDMHHVAMGNHYMLSAEHHNMDLMDEFLDIPGYDEPRRSSESYDYSVSMGPSSTDPSSGRTPDTRITMSPSPFPMHFQPNLQHPEHASSSSPEASKLSPHLSPSSGSGSGGGNLMCEECGRTFDQIHKLNHHKRYHDRKHECPYQGCDKKFGTKTHLDRHINDKHLKSKAFHCTEPGCAYFKGGKAFPRKDNWRRHMVKKHGANQQTFDAMDEGMDFTQ